MIFIYIAIGIFVPTAIGFLISARQDIMTVYFKPHYWPTMSLTMALFAYACAELVLISVSSFWLRLTLLPIQILAWWAFLMIGWSSILFGGAWLIWLIGGKRPHA